MGIEQGSTLNIKNQEFGFMESDVIEAREEAIKIAEDWKEALNGSDEKQRESAKMNLPSSIKEAEALSQNPTDVLNQVRKFYDRTVELGALVDEDELVRRLYKEFPELPNYYILLRGKAWGYHLGQAIIAERTLIKFRKAQNRG